MNWRSILYEAGISDEYLTGKHGPCPFCGGKDRWRFTDHEGKGLSICNQCGSRSAIQLIMDYNSWDFKKTANFIENLTGVSRVNDVKTTQTKPKHDYKANRARLANIKKGLRSLEHPSPTRDYLAGRGISELIILGCNNLYHHPGIKYWDTRDDKPVCLGEFPAMVAIVTCGDTPVTMLITFLTDAGEKANVPSPRKWMPPANKANYHEIKLFKPNYSDQTPIQLGVAEGIETALSVTQAFAVPCWSTISAGQMVKWRPPEDIDLIGIYGDSDESFTGQIAAYTLARDLKKINCTPKVFLPKTAVDYNDILVDEMRGGAVPPHKVESEDNVGLDSPEVPPLSCYE